MAASELGWDPCRKARLGLSSLPIFRCRGFTAPVGEIWRERKDGISSNLHRRQLLCLGSSRLGARLLGGGSMIRDSQLQVWVLIDALGWRHLEGREFLSDLLPYRRPLRTVLGFSSGAIPSLLTGRPPAENGHWNLFYYDPQGSPFRWLRRFAFLPDRVLDHRVTRKLVKELGRHALGLGPLFECCVSPRLLPWFNWIEKRNIYERGGITGARSIFDELSDAGIRYRAYSYHHWNDAQIFAQARRDLEARAASFFFVYLSELDHFLHMHRNGDDHLERRLGWYAASLRQLFQTARRLDPDARFTVVSDHGMTRVHHRYDLRNEVAALGFSMPDGYLAVYDSTMARFWFREDRARRAVVEYLKTLPCGRILPEEELNQLGILFPDRRYGELIFLLHPGWLLGHSDFNGPGWQPAAMHGYHPDDPDSDAVFLSNRQPQMPLRSITDVYHCMRAAMA